MLLPSLRRALRTRPSIPHSSYTTSPCRVCTCRCGALLPAAAAPPLPPPPPTALRFYATGRKAPSTRGREARPRAGSEASRQDLQNSLQYQRSRLDDFHNALLLPVSGDAAFEFVNRTASLADQTGRWTVDPVRFRALTEEYGLDMEACWIILKVLLEAAEDAKQSHIAKKLLYTMSRAGYARATIKAISEAEIEHKSTPMALRSSEIQYARAHLAQLANEGRNYRAMVLEGKVALALGEEQRAIFLWTRAVDMAVLVADADKAKGDFKPDPLELSSPWIELTQVHHKRGEMQKCLWAVEIGCKLDDPWSHYYKASFAKRVNSEGIHIGTAEWLYHMTKAAASHHQKAIHELAVFYAESGWKYIGDEDEPPDEIKPTPFDSYPGSSARTTSFWSSARESLGLKGPDKPSLQDETYHTAIFPSTAIERFELAFGWLQLNQTFTYAPSFFFAAVLHMQETLWTGANAPKSALELSDERYTFASKEDKYSDPPRPISRSPPPELQDPPNPFYSPHKAKQNLIQVFLAYEAHTLVMKNRDSYARARREGRIKAAVNEDGIADESQWPPQVRKWTRNSVVREMYEDEIEGLYVEAKKICNGKGWDLIDDAGGLVYRAKGSGAGKKSER